MMNTTATLERPVAESPRAQWSSDHKNPWTSDHVLLSLSVWWVRMTKPNSGDFSAEVATVFDSLQRDLQ
jgi:hypothetical protein